MKSIKIASSLIVLCSINAIAFANCPDPKSDKQFVIDNNQIVKIVDSEDNAWQIVGNYPIFSDRSYLTLISTSDRSLSDNNIETCYYNNAQGSKFTLQRVNQGLAKFNSHEDSPSCPAGYQWSSEMNCCINFTTHDILCPSSR